MTREEFQESLLRLMERKTHSAWDVMVSGRVPRERLHIHFEQEYETYVRDFPILIGRAYVQCPIRAVREELAENLYEEETGRLVAGQPHPVLFLEIPRGLGMDLARFENIELLPKAAFYRQTLDELTIHWDWDVATAVTTLFIEGTSYERGELDSSAKRRPEPPLAEHPLVRHYGLSVEHLQLTKAHRKVEGDHRQAAWRSVLEHTHPERRQVVLAAMDRALTAWLEYRDEVSATLGQTS